MRAHSQAVCDRIRRLRQVHSQRVVGEIVGIDRTVVSIIERRGFRAGGLARPPRPIPYDFAIQADVMTILQLCAHYTASSNTVTKWAKSIGRQSMWKSKKEKAIPPIERVAAALREHGASKAHLALGCGETSARKWRRHHNLDIRGNVLEDRSVGWAERMGAARNAR